MTAPDKIKEHLRAYWDATAAEAIEHGYDEVQAAAIATFAAVYAEDMEPVITYDYPAWRPGVYVAAVGGEFDVLPEDVEQMAEAINKKYQLGLPVPLIDGHRSKYKLGAMPAARVDGDVLRSACVTDWMTAQSIKTGMCGLSVEADRDHSSEAYTAGETFKYWPTAWAVLPVGEQPAVPPGEPIAAKDAEKPVRLYAQETAPPRGESPHGKEAEAMDELKLELEQLKAAQAEVAEKVSALETQRDELQAKLTAAEQERDELKAAHEAAELEAAEAETTQRAEMILAAAVPGIREKMQARLEAAEGLETKRGLLDAWEPLMDEKALEGARLQASESKPGDEAKSNADSLIDEANTIQAAEKCTFNEALRLAAQKRGEE